ncbi:MAG: adenylate kinase [Calditrichaeota bacterium]|nr:MAG: adenylate kinase [Calditrichota bacterium]
MNIALIGPSGAGKGTYAHKLGAEFNLLHVSTGEFLRLSLENKSALGLLAGKYMKSGEFVPDEIIDAIIEECLLKQDSQQGFLFDGFPRTNYQASFLNDVFTKNNRELDAVIYLDVPDQEIYRRLAGRLICRTCQLPHHMEFAPAKTCSKVGCGGELFRRDDDKDGIPAARLAVYRREIIPLLEYYQKSNKLAIIDADRAVESVTGTLQNFLLNLTKNSLRPATLSEIDKIKKAHLSTGKLVPDQTPVDDDGKNVILLGAPGSGKGTQANFIGATLNILQISTGDLFRENISDETELGKLARFYINRGELVPNDVTEEMVRERLEQNDTKRGIILDGFPRTLQQAEALRRMMAELGRTISAVIYIDVPDEAIVNRLTGRLTCNKCKSPFHQKFNPFLKCPTGDCSGEYLYQRHDDTPETVRKRLRTFHQQTRPLIDFYEQHKLLHRVRGNGSVKIVKEAVVELAMSL